MASDRSTRASAHAALHRRVIQGDAAALNDLARHVLPAMRRQLRRTFPLASDDSIGTAVDDAFLDYARRPHRVDLTRGVPLERCLMVAAGRNLANLQRSERRRRAREVSYARQQPSPPGSSEAAAVARPDRRKVREWILSVALDNVERRGLLLLLAGERATNALAPALNLSHLTEGERQHQVKLFKLRMVKRLQRAVGRG